MIKVKITRGCSIEGKNYGVGDVAEVIEKDRDLLWLSKKQWLMTGNANQKWLKRARNSESISRY